MKLNVLKGSDICAQTYKHENTVPLSVQSVHCIHLADIIVSSPHIITVHEIRYVPFHHVMAQPSGQQEEQVPWLAHHSARVSVSQPVWYLINARL